MVDSRQILFFRPTVPPVESWAAGPRRERGAGRVRLLAGGVHHEFGGGGSQKDSDFMQVGALLERRGGRMFLHGRRLRRGFAELGKQEGLCGGLLVFHRG